MAADRLAPEKAQLLSALTEEAKRAFTELLFLMEKGLEADPQREASQALAFEKQTAVRMDQARAALDNLLEAIAPWAETRQRIEPERAAEIDRFLELLEQGLGSLAQRVEQRRQDVQQRRDDIQQALDQIQKQRQGLKGYQVKGGRSRILEDRA